MKKLLVISLLLSFLVPAFAGDVKVYMMQPEGSLYAENEDGEMVWKASSYVGAEYTVIKLKDEKGKETSELDEKDAKRKSSGKLIDCHVYHVTTKDGDFYVLSDRVSFDANYAIVSKEATIYRSPDYADVLDKTLSVGTLVTYSSNNILLPINTTQKNVVKGFRKIQYFDNAAYTLRTGYVKQENLNALKDDLKALQIISKIQSTKDTTVKKELLNNAKNLTISEGVTALIENEKGKILSGDLSSGGTEALDTTMTVLIKEGEKINVRSLPGTDGAVVAQIEESVELPVTEKTKLQGNANDTTNNWYKVVLNEEGETGWIYGDFLAE